MSDNEGEAEDEAQEIPQIILPETFYRLHRNDGFMMEAYRAIMCPEEVGDLYLHHDYFCPFLHPNQTRRRHPHLHKYSPKLCPNIGNCPLGDACGFCHNIYEYCLHPKVYRRSNRCVEGENCMKFPCLFPHNPELLRASLKPPLAVPPRPRRPPVAPLPPLHIPPPRQGGRASRIRSKSV